MSFPLLVSRDFMQMDTGNRDLLAPQLTQFLDLDD